MHACLCIVAHLCLSMQSLCRDIQRVCSQAKSRRVPNVHRINLFCIYNMLLAPMPKVINVVPISLEFGTVFQIQKELL